MAELHVWDHQLEAEEGIGDLLQLNYNSVNREVEQSKLYQIFLPAHL